MTKMPCQTLWQLWETIAFMTEHAPAFTWICLGYKQKYSALVDITIEILGGWCVIVI